MSNDTHSKAIGEFLWIFGFTDAHRFHYDYCTLNGQIDEINRRK